MLYLVFVGITAFVFGLLFLCSPQTVRDLNDKGNRMLASFDDMLFKLRIGVGVSLILSSFLCFFVAYYLITKYGLGQ